MKNLSYLILVCLLAFTVSCKDNNDPLGRISMDEVRNVQVVPTEGGARLYWELPPNASGSRLVFITPADEYPFLPEVVVEQFAPEYTSFEMVDEFLDTSEQMVLIQALYGNMWTDGVQVRFNPLLPFAPQVRNHIVHYRPTDVLVTWELPIVPDNMTLLGFRIVYSLRDDGNYTDIVLDPHITEYEIEVPLDISLVRVRIYAIYVDDDGNDRVSRDYPIMVVMLEPVPVENIVPNSIPGGARITWNAPAGRPDFMGVRVIFQYGPGGRVFELFRRAPTAVENPLTFNFVELIGYSNTNPHIVRLYTVFGRGEYATDVTIHPGPIVWHGQHNFDMPGFVDIHGQRFVIWEQLDWGASETDADWHAEYQRRTTLRGDLFVPPGRRATGQGGFSNAHNWVNAGGNTSLWFPGGDRQQEQDLNHFIYGAIGNVPEAGRLAFQVPAPVYVTFDMGRRARFYEMAFLVRNRAGGVTFPTRFNVWGTNEITPEDTFGSRIESLEYWTSWNATTRDGTVINGTDAWKNNWTLLAENQWIWPDGPITSEPDQQWRSGWTRDQALGANNTFLSRALFDGAVTPITPARRHASFAAAGGAFSSRGTGFTFPMNTTGAPGSYRYLRLEIFEVNFWDIRGGNNNGNGFMATRNLQIHALKFLGEYDEYTIP